MSPFSTTEIEALKVAVSGLFGALTFAFLRHPGGLPKAIFSVALSTGLASIFAGWASGLTGIGVVQISALIGMVGLAIANRLIAFAEHLDIAKWIKK